MDPAPPLRVVVVAYYGGDDRALPGPPVPPEFHNSVLKPTRAIARRNVIGAAVDALVAHGVPTVTFPLRERPATRVRDLVATLHAHGATWCLWWDQSVVSRWELEEVRARVPGVAHAVYNWDPCRGVFALPLDHPGRYDLAFVTDAAVPGIYTCPTVTAHVPVNCAVFRPLPEVVVASGGRYRWDVSFAATNFYDEVARPGGLTRRALCRALAQEFGPKFALFGPPGLVAGDPVLAASHQGYVAYPDLPYVAAASGVCLALGVFATMHQYMNERLACLAACGAHIVSDAGAGLQELLGPHAAVFVPAAATVGDFVAAVRAAVTEAGTPVGGARRTAARAAALACMDAHRWASTVAAGLRGGPSPRAPLDRAGAPVTPGRSVYVRMAPGLPDLGRQLLQVTAGRAAMATWGCAALVLVRPPGGPPAYTRFAGPLRMVEAEEVEVGWAVAAPSPGEPWPAGEDAVVVDAGWARSWDVLRPVLHEVVWDLRFEACHRHASQVAVQPGVATVAVVVTPGPEDPAQQGAYYDAALRLALAGCAHGRPVAAAVFANAAGVEHGAAAAASAAAEAHGLTTVVPGMVNPEAALWAASQCVAVVTDGSPTGFWAAVLARTRTPDALVVRPCSCSHPVDPTWVQVPDAATIMH